MFPGARACREIPQSVTLSDESNGATSGRLGACNDAKDFQPFHQALCESAAKPVLRR